MLKIQQRKLMPEIWHTKTDRTTRARLFHNHTKPENSTHLADVDLLEPPLEGGVLLNVLPVLVQCRCAHAPQRPASQSRLEHLTRVHAALACSGAHQQVDLVDEQDDASV
jgi:hypothetical protein